MQDVFGELLEEARQHNLDYQYRHGQAEQFVLIDKLTGREWTRDNPGGCIGLLRRLIKYRKEGRL